MNSKWKIYREHSAGLLPKTWG